MLRTETRCPECDGPVESGWIVCAECGASLGPNTRRAPGKNRESALPSGDIGDTPFVPFVGGAKRPVTFVHAHPPRRTPVDTPALSPLRDARRDTAVPAPPPTEDNRHRITVLRPDPVPLVQAGVTDLDEDPLYVNIDDDGEDTTAALPAAVETDPNGPVAVEPEVGPATPDEPEVFEAHVPGPDLELVEADPEVAPFDEDPVPLEAVAKVRLAPKKPLSLHIAREDLAEIQTIVDQVIRQRLREVVAAQAAVAARAQLAAEAAREVPVLRRIAAGGTGLVIGAAVADMVVLNWDVWVRGELVSSVGWLQQFGIIGAAALAGAGASAALIGASLGRRRRKAARARAAA